MIRNRLKVIIAKRNLNQNELSEQLKISKSTLSNIINGKQNATLETAMELAKILNTRVEEIFYLEEDKDESEEEFLDLINKMNELYKTYISQIISKDQLEYLYEDLLKTYLMNYDDGDLFCYMSRYSKEYNLLNEIGRSKMEECLDNCIKSESNIENTK